MRQRSHSRGMVSVNAADETMSVHSANVRSLMDSPDNDSSSDTDAVNSEALTGDVFDGISDISSNALMHPLASSFGHVGLNQQHQPILLPLHRQPGNDVRAIGSEIETPRASGSMRHHQQQQQQQQQAHYRNGKTGYINMRQRLPYENDNKRPELVALSRQSTFESTSTFQSDHQDPSTCASATSVATVRSSASSTMSKFSPVENGEQTSSIRAMHHGNNVNAAPLVLASSESTPNDERGQQKNNNTLILNSTNGAKRDEGKNTMLTNLLSNVQLPRPRLIPFTPIVSREAQRSRQEAQSPIITAASFAKDAPKAGYLSKLGSSVSEYKRRFFVLKPTTCLYYFMSPNDEEPRGCIDLDGFVNSSDKSGMGGLKVNSLGTLPDGRFRFECILPIQNDDPDGPRTRKVLLEARNEEVGKEWMHSLTMERLSYSKATGELLQDQVRELESEKKQLEERLHELRLAEKDRDGAIDDAKAWRKREEKLNNAVCMLKRWMSQSVENNGGAAEGMNVSSETSSSDGEWSNGHKTLSLSVSKDDQALDEIEVPGTSFSALVNVCRGLKENLRLTSIEASTALEDLRESNREVKALEDRMVKAEKDICRLWEENFSARATIKQKKHEKKILVNEVRSLMEKSSLDKKEIERLRRENEELKKKDQSVNYNEQQASSSEKLDKKCLIGKRQLSTPQKKLLFDLEDHVNTTLNQHGYLLNSNEVSRDKIKSPPRIRTVTPADPSFSAKTAKKSNASADVSRKECLPHKLFEARDGDSSSEDDDNNDECTDKMETPKRSISPLLPKQLSLMDQAALDEAKDAKNEDNVSILISNPSLSLTTANLEVFEKTQRNAQKAKAPVSSGSDLLVGPESKNHFTSEKLDVVDSESDPIGPSDFSFKSLVTNNTKATSTLACPLTDVTRSSPTLDRTKVYSLTFHMQKIGIQFQKVPNNERQSGGLLTEAMTADIGEKHSDDATSKSRTEAELRIIASLSNPSHVSTPNQSIKDQSCPVLLPKHYVLVCGFQGFDGSSNNRRPSLGARLVGFDGISIERGPWTFEAVRKAIKARGRPLTLTFRDDFLTTEQRSILTKAANEVEHAAAANQPPRPNTRQVNIPATINAETKPGDRIVGKSPSSSDISRDFYSHDDSTTLSTCSRSSDNWRTFSDTGSSSVFSSKLSPFVTGLMSGIYGGEKKQDGGQFTPDHFRRSTDSLDSISHHKEFKAGLL